MFRRAFAIALVVITVSRGIFIFFPPVPAPWGISLFAFLPPEFALVLFAISVGAIVWMVKDAGHPAPPRRPRFNIFSRSSLLLLPVCAGVIFFFCTITVSLLGDGALFEGDLYRFTRLHQAVPLYYEPLTMLLNSRVAALLYWLGISEKGHVAYQITGAMFGVLFVAVALKISSSLRTSHGVRVMAFVLLLSCGGTLLFFGYVENYAPQYAMVALYMALLFHMFRMDSSPFGPLVVLVLCCLLHLQNVLLIPSFVAALGMRIAGKKGIRDRFGAGVYRTALVAAPLFLLVYAFFQWKPIGGADLTHSPFIPFVHSAGDFYTLLSPVHLVDLVCEHLLLASLTLALLAVLVLTMRRAINWTSPEIVCIVVATMFMEAFLIGGNLALGLGRDWDVVATLGLLLTLLVVKILEQGDAAQLMNRRTITAAIVVASVGAIGWVSVNVDEDSAIARYSSLVEYYRPVVKPFVTRYAYENLRKHYFQRGEWTKELETLSSMLHVFPCHVDLLMFLITARSNAAELGPLAGDAVARELSFGAEHFSEETLREELAGDDHSIRINAPGVYPLSIGDLSVRGAVELYRFYKTWSLDDAQAFGDSMIGRHPALPYGYELKGWLDMLAGDTLRAREFLRRAVDCDEKRAHSLVMLAVTYNASSTTDSVYAISNRALKIDAGSADALTVLCSAVQASTRMQNDTAILETIAHAARTCLTSAKERDLSAEQINTVRGFLNYAMRTMDELHSTIVQ